MLNVRHTEKGQEDDQARGNNCSRTPIVPHTGVERFDRIDLESCDWLVGIALRARWIRWIQIAVEHPVREHERQV